MSAYVPPHRRNKGASGGGPAAAAAASRPAVGNSRWGAAPEGAARGRPGPGAGGGLGLGGLSLGAAGSPPKGAGVSASSTTTFGGRRTLSSAFDARSGGGGGGGGGEGGGRYVSAYDAAHRERLETKGEAPDAAATEVDDKAQYAKLIEFSRYRREELGQRRAAAPDDGSGRNRRGRQSAPRAFGTNDHGRGMEFDEDLPGCTRVDTQEGMVYERADDGSGVYFCDRFRRYKFFSGQETGHSTSLRRGCSRRDSQEESMARFEFAPRDDRSSKNETHRGTSPAKF